MSGGDWILTPKYFVSRHHGGEEEKKRKREEEKKRKKEEQQGCHLWGSIWDGICRLFLFLLLFFLNLCMCSRVVTCGALFEMGFVRFFLFIIFFFLNLCMAYRM